MPEERAKRKLSAILSADVKGYSRLMGEDELATVRTLEAYREMIAEVIRDYRGRVVDSPGDNVLAEFASVVDAVESAVDIQKELKAKNAEVPENRRMEFRIGINLGDVIEEGERIYGDGVNIAARIEGLAGAGEICISGTAFDQVESKLGLEFEYLGEQSVKNIKKPVRVYRAQMESVVSDVETRQELPLPDKPSIAVLPFVNMSGDPEQEYFSDGMSEDIIAALSRVPEMFVIARNSTFTYKGKPVNVQQVSRELGVRYVLEGSVRKAGDRVRITAQLIDATTGHHLWAERYDRDLKDIFAIQDEITLKILKALQVKLIDGEQARLYAKGTENIDAYLKMGQARSYLNRFNRGSNLLARQICEEIIAFDPKWELPYSVLGWTYWMDVRLGWSDSPEESVQEAFQLAQKSISMNESSMAHGLLGFLYTQTHQHEKAKEESEKSIALDPNSADAHAGCANTLIFAREPEKAISLIEKALRLNPFPPSWYFVSLGSCYRMLARFEEAIQAYKKAIYIEPTNLFARLYLGATYALDGQEMKARAQAEEVLRIDPSFSVEYLAKTLPFKDDAQTWQVVDALRKAGLK
ncbi:MAG: adenylate/guanylate cyclase domain-containing protein [Desulfobacteraceae bacterium]|jgi:adenylate cyclase